MFLDAERIVALHLSLADDDEKSANVAPHFKKRIASLQPSVQLSQAHKKSQYQNCLTNLLAVYVIKLFFSETNFNTFSLGLCAQICRIYFILAITLHKNSQLHRN